MPRPGLEFAKSHFTQDGNDVAPIEADGADVENPRNGRIRAETNQVDGNTPKDTDPHSIERGPSPSVHYGPNIGEGEQAVTGEGEDGPTESLRGSEADELQDDKCADGVEDTTRLSQRVVE